MTISVSSVYPVNPHYGVYAGVPIARHYIDEYMRGMAASIRGRVLEFGRPTYAAGLACDYEIIDIDEANADASFHADISGDWDRLDRPDRYDWIICTAVLQLVPDPQRAVDNMQRMLKPGGRLILAEKSVPKVDSWCPTIDRWRFTQYGLEYLLRKFGSVTVQSHGNVYVLCAYLLGLPVEAVERDKLAVFDPEHPLVSIACAEK
jgi:SAM-dependent methyltransferase